MKEESRCENCRYYKEHYIEYKGRFMRTWGATCINTNMRLNTRMSDTKRNVACDKWEPFELQRIEEREAIEKVIRDMQKKLSNIEQTLEFLSGD